MNNQEYFSFPTISANKIAFVHNDKIFLAPINGGNAVSLTAQLGIISHLQFSPSGNKIAFNLEINSKKEIFLLNIENKKIKQLTYFGVDSIVKGWKEEEIIVFTSSFNKPFFLPRYLYTMSIKRLIPNEISYGYGESIKWDDNLETIVILRGFTRKYDDLGLIKRYKGGTRGKLWIKTKESIDFKLFKFSGNITNPIIISNRIFFLSDYKGIGNIFSINFKGKDLKQYTFNNDYFIRHMSYNNGIILYQAKGSLYKYNLKTNIIKKIEIDFEGEDLNSDFKKNFEINQYLESFEIRNDMKYIALISRGKLIIKNMIDNEYFDLISQYNIRYKFPRFIPNDKLVAISNEKDGTFLEIFNLKEKKLIDRFEIQFEYKIHDCKISTNGNFIALTTVDNKLYSINLKNHLIVDVDKSYFQLIEDIYWIPNKYLMIYSKAETAYTKSIIIFDIINNSKIKIVSPLFANSEPIIDSNLNYLFFISNRDFTPTFDNIRLNLTFVKGMHLYYADLNKLSCNTKKYLDFEKLINSQSNDEFNNQEIEKRITYIHTLEGLYRSLSYHKPYLYYIRTQTIYEKSKEIKIDSLFRYNLITKQEFLLKKAISSYMIKQETIILILKNKILYCQLTDIISQLKEEQEEAIFQEKCKSIQFEYNFEIDQKKEWINIFNDVWINLKTSFWNKDLSKNFWDDLYNKYIPLTSKISTRSELSDILWELYGELSCSHLYERNFSYIIKNSQRIFSLGMEYEESDKGGVKIANTLIIENWLLVIPGTLSTCLVLFLLCFFSYLPASFSSLLLCLFLFSLLFFLVVVLFS